MSSGPRPTHFRTVEIHPSGDRMTCQPIVRTRKFVQNGTITRATSRPRFDGAAFVAIQYATGAPMMKQRAVPARPIQSVFWKVAKNVGVSTSAYLSSDILSLAWVPNRPGL